MTVDCAGKCAYSLDVASARLSTSSSSEISSSSSSSDSVALLSLPTSFSALSSLLPVDALLLSEMSSSSSPSPLFFLLFFFLSFFHNPANPGPSIRSFAIRSIPKSDGYTSTFFNVPGGQNECNMAYTSTALTCSQFKLSIHKQLDSSNVNSFPSSSSSCCC